MGGVAGTGSGSDFLDGHSPIAFAHRGGGASEDENSMAAFERCVRLGYRYLETDVHVTADGVLVAFHDQILDRATDRTGRISRLPWSVVSKARIGGQHPIPLLEDLVGTWPDVRFNIDVKAPTAVAPLARALRRTAATKRVCVASFSDGRLAAIRRLLGPGLCTALAPREIAALRLASYSPRASNLVRFRGSCAQVPMSVRGRRLVDERFVATAHSHGLVVHVWTIDDATDMHSLLDLGVDGLMTDRPELLRDVLVSRGQWGEERRT